MSTIMCKCGAEAVTAIPNNTLCGSCFREEDEREVPCKRCERPTIMKSTRLCNTCWEIETQISYLISMTSYEKAEQIVTDILAEEKLSGS